MGRNTVGTAVFGASDGLMSILGPIMFTAARAPHLVFPIAVMGAVSAACSMGAGEFLGERAPDWRAVPAMAAATFTGSVLPALPYLWSAGMGALAQSGVACALTALAVGHMRSWRPHRYAETLVILAVVFAVTVACNLLMPAGSSGS